MSEDYYEEVETSITEDFINNEMTIGEKLAAQVQNTPWWLISFGAHVVVLIILALIVFEGIKEKDKQSITVTDDALAEVVEKRPERMERDTSDDIPTDENVEVSDAAVEVTVDTAATDFGGSEVEFNSETTFAVETTSLVQSDTTSDLSFSDFGSQLVGTAKLGSELLTGGTGPYKGRSGRNKKVRRSRGGGGDTAKNVDAGLKWLAEHQKSDGSWSVDGTDGKSSLYSTGFAVLAFLGDGHTTKSGKYKGTVRKGLDWLVTQQNAEGYFNHDGGRHGMYEHGIAAFAVCEGVAIGCDAYSSNALKAMDFCKKARHNAGGWGYKPNGSHSCLSVSGFNIQAVHGVELASKINRNLDKDFVKDCYDFAYKWGDDNSGKSGYHNPGGGSMAMCAVGALLRMYSGRVSLGDQFLEKAAKLIKESVDQACPDPEGGAQGRGGKGNSYFMYYGTLVMFQMSGDYWETWNPKMKKYLKHHQQKDGHWGKEMGAWWGDVAQTAICTMCFEVYYRYDPLLKKGRKGH